MLCDLAKVCGYGRYTHQPANPSSANYPKRRGDARSSSLEKPAILVHPDMAFTASYAIGETTLNNTSTIAVNKREKTG